MYTEDYVAAGFIAFIGGLCLSPLLLIWWAFQEPGNGQHTGYVTATETGGIFWQTDRAYIKTDTQSSQEEAYCVVNDEVLEKLREAQKEKKLITIEYSGEFIVPTSKCRGEAATITSVEISPN